MLDDVSKMVSAKLMKKKRQKVICNDDTSYCKRSRGLRRRFYLCETFFNQNLTRDNNIIIIYRCTHAVHSMRYCVTAVAYNNIVSNTYILGICIGINYTFELISPIDILNLLRNNHQSLVLESYTRAYLYIIHLPVAKGTVSIFTKPISCHSFYFFIYRFGVH